MYHTIYIYIYIYRGALSSASRPRPDALARTPGYILDNDAGRGVEDAQREVHPDLAFA